MDFDIFFKHVRARPFGGRMTQAQVDGCARIIQAFEDAGYNDERFLAYGLATAFHETGRAMQPVMETRQPKEASNPSVDVAIDRLEKSWKAGRMPWVKSPYWRKDRRGLSWLGRGDVQLTHERNYITMGRLLGVDLKNDPDLALDPEVSARIMVEGMTKGASSKGDFTGKALEDYFNDSKDDPVGARRIINGQDKAKQIAGYYEDFLAAIREARGDAFIAPRQKVRIPRSRPSTAPARDEVEVDREIIDDPTTIEQVQKRLRELGYFEVGEIDAGESGTKRTEGAILAFRNDNDLPLVPHIDKELLVSLSTAKKREIAPSRAEAKPAEVAKKVESVQASRGSKLWAWIIGVSSSVLASARGILSWFEDAWDSSVVLAVRETLSDNLGIILVATAGAAVMIWLNADKAEKKTTEAYNEGRLL